MSLYSEPMRFIDLVAQQKRIRPQLESAILSVLDHGNFIMGPEVRDLELELQKFSSCKHALTCANGTDALTLVLMAWGVGPGDAVFVPSFTYVATAEAPAQLGATPFFVDVCADTFNLDPESFKQAVVDCASSGLRPSVVIPVDLFGRPADIAGIAEVARNENIKILVDGAQSFGAKLNGQAVGTMGDATTTSFFPAKPLGCYGDGGAIFTGNSELASILDSIRLHGKGLEKYDNVRVGLNSRLDTIQAAILLQKLKLFPEELTERSEIAKRYNHGLPGSLRLPTIELGVQSAWAQYTVRSERRDELKKFLNEQNIPSVIYYPKALTQQNGYKNFPSVSTGTPISNELPTQVLSLPMHPYLQREDQQKIIDAVAFFESHT